MSIFAWNFVEYTVINTGNVKTVYQIEEIILSYTRFFINNTFISNARLKLAKNQANAKQHPEAELLLFENYSLFFSRYSKNVQKTSTSVSMRFND